MKKSFFLSVVLLIINLFVFSEDNKEYVNLFVEKYSGININTTLNELTDELKNKSVTYSKINKNLLIIEKTLCNNDNIKNTVFEYKKNKLNNIIVIIEVDNDSLKNTLNIIKNDFNKNNFIILESENYITISHNLFPIIKIKIENIQKELSWIVMSYNNYGNEINENLIEIKNHFNLQRKFDISTTLGFYYYPCSFEFYNNLSNYNLNLGAHFYYSYNYYFRPNITLGFITGLNFGILSNLYEYRQTYIPDDYNDQRWELSGNTYYNFGFDIRVINKIGAGIFKRYALLTEYGLSLNGRIDFDNNMFFYGSYYYYNEVSIFLFAGPSLFLGFEYQKEFYTFSFGGIFKALFGQTQNYHGKHYNENDIYIKNLNFGFEWRLGFIYTKFKN